MPYGSLMDKVFTIGVVHKPRNPFRRVQMIGTAKIGMKKGNYSLTHSHTHSLTHSLTLILSLTHSFTHSLYSHFNIWRSA